MDEVSPVCDDQPDSKSARTRQGSVSPSAELESGSRVPSARDLPGLPSQDEPEAAYKKASATRTTSHSLTPPNLVRPEALVTAPLSGDFPYVGVDEPNGESQYDGELPRTLTLFNGIMLVIGTIVGSGIFASPGPVVRETGSPGAAMIVWLTSGIVAAFGGLAYSELGGMMRGSGGEFIYLKETYGSLPAFLFCWICMLLLKTGSGAINSLVFAQYLYRSYRILSTESFSEGEGSRPLIKSLSILCILMSAMLNVFSTRMATRLIDITSIFKALGLILIGALGIFHHARSDTDVRWWDGTSSSPGSWTLAYYSGLFAYEGWNGLNYVAGELIDPKRNLPLAILGGLSLVSTLYLWVNWAYFAVLPVNEVAKSTSVGLLFGEATLGNFGVFVMSVCIVFSTLGAVNGNIFGGSRVAHTASEYGYMPKSLAKLHPRYGTPAMASIFQAVCMVLLIVTVGDFDELVEGYSYLIWLFYGLTFYGLIKLRTSPNYEPQQGAIQVPLWIPRTMIVVAVFLVVLPISRNPLLSAMGMGVVLVLCGAWWWWKAFVMGERVQLPSRAKLRTTFRGWRSHARLLPSSFSALGDGGTSLQASSEARIGGHGLNEGESCPSS